LKIIDKYDVLKEELNQALTKNQLLELEKQRLEKENQDLEKKYVIGTTIKAS
jgi:2-phosphoglycerate kinase